MRLKFLSIFLLITFLLHAQKHENNWIIGGSCPTESGNARFSIAQLNFAKNPKKINSILDIDFSMLATNISVSNEIGELQFYSNGNDIMNWQHEIMINGAQLTEPEECNARGITQGMICLPFPDQVGKYILFQGQRGFVDELSAFADTSLFYSIVDMNENNGEGEVIVRNQMIIEDYLFTAGFNLVKHANGRDWWGFVFKFDSNEYYQLLISPNGIKSINLLQVDTPVFAGLRQTMFSPDGESFGIVSNISTFTGGFLYVFDVDRCAGTLEKRIDYAFPPIGSGGAVGLAFSPNSRFMYVGLADILYQYDLSEQDLEDSKVIVATENGTDNGVPFLTRFFTMQLALDGKIYIAKSIDNTFMHVIHEPDKKGLACEVELRGLVWPNSVNFSIPNNPNYRLGPLDGSSCDTLGIDNNTVANFIFEEEEPTSLDYSFKDLSYYEPETWAWDFGDGTSSSERNPLHTFADFGNYTICLTVSNANASDTYCEELCVHPNPYFVSFIDAEYLILDCNQFSRIECIATVNGEPVSDLENVVVSWKNPTGEIFSEQEEINISSGGNYELTITDTIIGCSSTDEIFIHENFFPPRFTYTKDREYLPCEGNLEISLQIDTNCYNVQWRDGFGGILTSFGDQFTVTNTGTFIVSVLNCETGCGNSEIIAIESAPILADWTIEQQLDLVYQFNPEFEEDLDHFWDFGDMNSSAEANPIHTYAEAGVYTVTHIVSNACGSDTLSATIEVIITSTNSIQEAGLEIFPNPTKDYLTIHSVEKEIAQIDIYSTLGQKVFSQKESSREVKIDVLHFSAGVYWLSVRMRDGGVLNEKVIVE